MLIEVGKFTFPADFVILQREEDSKVPLILGIPFLHTADAVIQVKHKQLNLGVGTERMIFHINSTMKHSYSNDDTCFSIDVIDKILEGDFDSLLDEDYKIKTSLKEPPTDLELKPLPDNLDYAFLEEPFFLSVIISSQLFEENKNKLISILKKHKQAFAWKTTDIPGICPSFYKHKIQLLEDKKPVVQKQRRLNLNMQEVVKKEIVKLLDTSIIYKIVDIPWVIPIQCVPKKCGITVVTNERDELVPQELLQATNNMLQCCKDAHLVLNWEKCYFMVKEGILLGYTRNLISKLKTEKGTENVAADHLFWIENDETSDDSKVNDNFPGETLMEINTRVKPWFTNFANYSVSDIIPKGMTYQQKNKSFFDLKHYFWEEPYLFKVCSDGMIRRCVSGPETQTILDQCHHGPTGGHYGPNTTAKKVLDSGFYWPTIIKEAHT
ncbi:reverse transcriptase domain-containing protein [Tanacetum coccineum]